MIDDKENLCFDSFVYSHKRQAARKIAQELLESLCAHGFTTDDLLYALADIFEKRGGLDEAADGLQTIAEGLPPDLKWWDKDKDKEKGKKR
jgi:hypothetical protein